MPCIKEEIALRETHNPTADIIVPGELDVDMKKARPKGPVSDNPTIMPPHVDLGTTSSDSSSREDIIRTEATNLLNVDSISSALKKELDLEAVSISHWEGRPERRKKLFEEVEDDLRLTRNTLVGSEKQNFLEKEMYKHYRKFSC